ncbi:SusC/RagA family TonB-linked outer membrane protein [Pedobacter sp. MC2016-05]|uniref:SusC/RagA family TonB-linked outer membrane protein n=1 Tax=Pedobacter sp. MC2016-05 TaxID=2994474 RepID=UPI002245DE17|nr:SusC/RagA family TonB-linked outer membrane protein [Pedobacter sp. MC2016-05]MCX2473758.1 SusC/RagA family TonB-linked outer membrane protein [Pedobacter sp. MC2016-05]
MKYFYSLIFFLALVLGKNAYGQQTIAVNGTVIDGSSKKKEGLPGVSITRNGKFLASTDANGKFRVIVPADAELSISYVSYTTQTIKVNARTSITITLIENTNALQEVKVTAGYVTKTQKLTTGSVTKISGKDIQGQPASDVISLLQGKVAGLNIQNSTGAPGYRGSVTIRGISNIDVSGSGGSSFLTPTSPLFVIDGVPVDDNTNYSYGFQQAGPGVSPVSQIPPEDIEDIQVLKDASATALYGSRGAYGVILITTKRGNSKVPIVRYSGSTFVSLVPQLRSTLGGRGERMLRIDQILRNDTGATRIHALDMINSTPFLADSLNAYYNNSTDWQSYFYKNTLNQNHSVNVSGGDVAFNYKVILGAYDEKGIQANTGYSRYNLNMNMTFNPTTKFKLTAQLQNSIQKQQTGSGNGLINTGIGTANQSSSLLPAPSLYSSSNALLAQLTTDNDNKLLNTFATINAEYEVVKNLRLATFLNYTNTTGTKDNFSPAALNGNQSQYYTYNDRATKLYNRTQATYNKSFQDSEGNDAHNFLLFTFMEINSSFFKADAILNQRGVNDQLRGPLTNQFDYQNSRGGTIDYTDLRSVAFAGAFSYNYRQKYVLDLNYRLDANSQNGVNAGYIANPSIGLKWNFNEEKWLKGLSWLDFADIRLSYGSNIQPVGSIFDAYGQYTGGFRYNNASSVIINLGRVPNLDLQPTKATTFNAGMDLQVFKNRLSFTMDAYYKQNDNIFRYKNISSTNAFGTVASNEISNVNYGLEFQAIVRPLSNTSAFKWTLNGNLAINREVLAQLPDGLRDMIYYDTTNGQDIYYRLGTNSLSNYLYNTKGVYATGSQVPVDPLTGLPYRVGGAGLLNFFKAGDPIFTDLDGNYVLNEADKLIAGNSQPLITGGFTSFLQWKSWSLEVNTSFTLKRDILNNPLARQLANYNLPTTLGALIPLDQLNYWQAAGDAAQYGNPLDFVRAGIISPFRLAQTAFQEDGSYFKLNSIKVYYNFNPNFTRKLGMSRVSINATGANLGFITRYSGPNPENVTALGRDDSGGYPLPKQFTLGLNIEF